MSRDKGQGTRDEGGFTILLAALVASIALALGTSIFTLALKGLSLSSMGRDSQFAFYAADTAAECALYWDVRHDFASTTNPSTQIQCDGPTPIEVGHSTLPPPAGAGTYPITFDFEFEPNGRCAKVTVTKQQIHPHTRIHADGYNTTCADISISPNALERSVELKY